MLVKSGRIYQEISPVFSPLDSVCRWFFLPDKKKKQIPLIVILAPPRSGSTLTYQLLTSGIENFHLTNIWNLLYATPFIGASVSEKLIARKSVSTFSSNHGFVPGLTGEAEGLKFWKYWMGQTLEEEQQKIKINKLRKLANIIYRLGYKYDKSFITGYLGHVFSVNELREAFNHVIFIHLTRDLLSNAYSVYQISPKNWFSTKPQGVDMDIPRNNQIVQQLISIHKNILHYSQDDTCIIKYEDLCADPLKIIDEILDFGTKKQLHFQKSKYVNMIPGHFEFNKTKPAMNEITGGLYEILHNEISKCTENERIFFNKIL